jgi:hypothetical protein
MLCLPVSEVRNLIFFLLSDYCQAFASTAGAGGVAATTSPGESSVPSICNVLEDSGLTIRRCSDPEEAISRARDLQKEGQLRCIIIGGTIAFAN